MDLFFIKGDGIFSDKKILSIILDESEDDVLGYFPEYKPDFDRIRRKLGIFIQYLKNIVNKADEFPKDSRKSFAERAKEYKNNDILFRALNEDIWNKSEEDYYEFMKSYVLNIPLSKLIDMLEEGDYEQIIL